MNENRWLAISLAGIVVGFACGFVWGGVLSTSSTMPTATIQSMVDQLSAPQPTSGFTEEDWEGTNLKCPDGSTHWFESDSAEGIVQYYEWGCYEIDPYTGKKLH